ncbi:hypothetical protein ACFYPT_37715 [Streptomyces sp. NPDC005529]
MKYQQQYTGAVAFEVDLKILAPACLCPVRGVVGRRAPAALPGSAVHAG